MLWLFSFVKIKHEKNNDKEKLSFDMFGRRSAPLMKQRAVVVIVILDDSETMKNFQKEAYLGQ